MILENALPRLKEAHDLALKTKTPQRVTFIYNELPTYDTIESVFGWLYKQAIEFGIKYEEYRFVIIICPKYD